MLFFAADTTNPNSQSGHGLVQAQALLQTAMRRLQFLLDKHDESQQAAGASAAAGASSIRAVAEAMMAAGYGKECISTFKSPSHGSGHQAAASARLLTSSWYW